MASGGARIGRRSWLSGLAAGVAAGLAPGRGAASRDTVERVMVIGDSQAQGLAAGLQWLSRQDHGFHVLDRSKISTGLTSRSAYDWPAQVHALAAGEHADVAVVMFGANDRPPVRVGGHVDPGLLKNFQAAYGARVREIVQTLVQAQTAVIWVGHPIVRDPIYADDMAILDGIFAEAATAAGAEYLSLWEVFQDAEHNYSAYGPGVDGQTTRLRADDGVHLTPAGYQVAARLLQPLLAAHRPAPT